MLRSSSTSAMVGIEMAPCVQESGVQADANYGSMGASRSPVNSAMQQISLWCK
jgi:hypothetical protein